MGKASRWFRAVLGLKKPEPPPPSSSSSSNTTTRFKEKRRWSFVKSHREKDSTTTPPPPSSSTKRGVPYSHHHGVDPAAVAAAAAAGVVVTSSTSTKEFYDDVDPNKHAIAVAAATAAVADAAVAAAHAAAEVVRLTSSGRCGNSGGNGNTNSSQQHHHRHRQEDASGGESVIRRRAKEEEEEEELAAVKIQAAFRGYLARRALKALRALVKLQALVRGHIERKRTAEWLHRMQALLRAQARARAGRAQISESSNLSGKSCHFHHPGPPTPEKFEHSIRTKSGKYEHSTMFKRTVSKSNGREINDNDKAHLGFNWSDRRMDERSWDQQVPYARSGPIGDERSDKILEVDTGKPHLTPKRRNLFHSHHGLASDQYSQSFTTSKDSTTHQIVRSTSSGEVKSLSPLKFSQEVEEAFCTADNSPQFYSASSKGASGKRSPFTPTRSDGSRSFLSGFSDYPNYMSYTESSRAKVRSLSAPKQRPQYERSSSTKRYSVHSLGEPRSSSAQRASALRASFANKAYPGSGRLDRLGMPIGQRYY